MLRLFASLLFTAFFSTQALAQTEHRIALVVGNGAYHQLGWSLPNPVNDAELINKRLVELGFEVTLVKNANRQGLKNAFIKFGEQIVSGPATTEVVFYYAGHAAQFNGANYLIPVDSKAQTLDELQWDAPPVQMLFEYMRKAQNAVNIVILDACRNVPLQPGMRGGTRGLANQDFEAASILVAYSAGWGQTAADGDGPNSPYTTILNTWLLDNSGEYVANFFASLEEKVLESTNYKQSPQHRYSLSSSQWTFKKGGGIIDHAALRKRSNSNEPSRIPALFAGLFLASIAAAWLLHSKLSNSVRASLMTCILAVVAAGIYYFPHAQVAAESSVRDYLNRRAEERGDAEAFAEAQAAGTLESYRNYTEAHPTGAFLRPAQEHIGAFTDDATWAETFKTNSIDAYEQYIVDYPSGRHVDLAKTSLAKLKLVNFQFCNDSPKTISIATINKKDGAADWSVSGWYNVQAGSCSPISKTGAREIYYTGNSGNNSWGSGYSACVTRDAAFSLAVSTSCIRGSELAHFSKFTFGNSVAPQTIRLNKPDRTKDPYEVRSNSSRTSYEYSTFEYDNWADDADLPRVEARMWSERPTFADLEKFYPARAHEREKTGRVNLTCNIAGGGTLSCGVKQEIPDGWGFGKAAISVSKLYRIDQKYLYGKYAAGSIIALSVTFSVSAK